ncbi:MAG: RNA polymerase sporulation sigma factor SigH [Clostridia bacterium]|nr:RNA polymerase sporulation sigma factor SigH [Clostridia bacterium]
MTNDYDSMKENDVIALAKNNDERAMEYVMYKYLSLARAKSRSYFLIGADSEDIMQEGMIGLYKAIMDFDSTITPCFPAFAELCITRQILTAVKAATRQKHQPLNSYVSLSKPVDEGDDRTLADILYQYGNSSPEDFIISKETTGLLMNKIKESLSKLENQVLLMYLKGEDYRRISLLMDKPAKSIDNALQRIRRKISGIAAGMSI